MRWTIFVLVLATAGCSRDGEGESKAQAMPATAAQLGAAAKPLDGQSSPLMAIPEDPETLKRLEAMGYTIHEDHLHAPGVTSCPKMGDDPVM